MRTELTITQEAIHAAWQRMCGHFAHTLRHGRFTMRIGSQAGEQAQRFFKASNFVTKWVCLKLLSSLWFWVTQAVSGYGILFVEWVLRQIRHYLALSTCSVQPFPWLILQTDRLKVKSFVAGLVCPVVRLQSTSLFQKDKKVGMKAPCRPKLDFSMFSELWGSILCNGALLSGCGEQSFILATACGVWESPRDSLGQ